MFSIHSTTSSRELIFSNHKDDYFRVELVGDVTAAVSVWAYTDANGLCELFQDLGNSEKPWQGVRSWSSIEGELTISSSCSTLGDVHFEIQLYGMPGAPEEWKLTAGLTTEFGQLQHIAKKAKVFFHVQST